MAWMQRSKDNFQESVLSTTWAPGLALSCSDLAPNALSCWALLADLTWCFPEPCSVSVQSGVLDSSCSSQWVASVVSDHQWTYVLPVSLVFCLFWVFLFSLAYQPLLIFPKLLNLLWVAKSYSLNWALSVKLSFSGCSVAGAFAYWAPYQTM